MQFFTILFFSVVQATLENLPDHLVSEVAERLDGDIDGFSRTSHRYRDAVRVSLQEKMTNHTLYKHCGTQYTSLTQSVGSRFHSSSHVSSKDLDIGKTDTTCLDLLSKKPHLMSHITSLRITLPDKFPLYLADRQFIQSTDTLAHSICHMIQASSLTSVTLELHYFVKNIEFVKLILSSIAESDSIQQLRIEGDIQSTPLRNIFIEFALVSSIRSFELLSTHVSVHSLVFLPYFSNLESVFIHGGVSGLLVDHVGYLDTIRSIKLTEFPYDYLSADILFPSLKQLECPSSPALSFALPFRWPHLESLVLHDRQPDPHILDDILAEITNRRNHLSKLGFVFGGIQANTPSYSNFLTRYFSGENVLEEFTLSVTERLEFDFGFLEWAGDLSILRLTTGLQIRLVDSLVSYLGTCHLETFELSIHQDKSLLSDKFLKTLETLLEAVIQTGIQEFNFLASASVQHPEKHYQDVRHLIQKIYNKYPESTLLFNGLSGHEWTRKNDFPRFLKNAPFIALSN